MSVACARKIYGVVINNATMTVNPAKTKALRKKLRAAGVSRHVTVPNVPGAADWAQRRLRPGDEFLIDPQ